MFTVGIWVIVWIFLIVLNGFKSYHCRSCGTKDSVVIKIDKDKEKTDELDRGCLIWVIVIVVGFFIFGLINALTK